MKIFLIFLLGYVSAAVPIWGSSAPMPKELVINNRILATVNGKTLSVLDVVKQMDVFLSQHYPEYLESPATRLQFYNLQWRPTLHRMIDEELMMADAESRSIKTTEAEVREEIMNRYGPNVMESLDRLGLSYDEAKTMIHQEIVVQKIQWLRVTSKVLPKVTTEVLKKAYDDRLRKNPAKEVWAYQFLTFRHENKETALSLALQIKSSYDSFKGNLHAAIDSFKQKLTENEWKLISLSPDLNTEDKELSSSHRRILNTLSLNEWSTPIVETSRDGTQVIRIFHLKSHIKQEAPSFEVLAPSLKQELLNQQAEKEMQLYLKRLRKRFGYDEKFLDLPAKFEPFSF